MKIIKIAGAENKVYKEVLDNGLTIYVLPGDTKGITMNLTVNYGSSINDFRFKGETEYKHLHLGVAHFLEHLTFKMKDGDANDYFASYGADCNAFTSYDITNYEVWTTSHMKECLSYLLTYVLTPFYNVELVENEKGIILEEAKRNLDNIRRKMVYATNENLFHEYNSKYPIVGTIEDIKAITLEDIENAYYYFYKPYNMTLSVFGNIDPKEVIEIAKNTLDKYKYEVKEIELKEINEKPSILKDRVIVKDKNKTPIVDISYKIPLKEFEGLTLKEIDIAVYLLHTCELSMTSDYAESLKNNKTIVGYLNYYHQIFDDYLVLTYSANTEKPEEFIKELKNKISNLNINEDDLIRKKRAAIAHSILIYDNINDIASGFAHEYFLYGEDTFEETDILKNMDIDTIKKVEEIIKKCNTSVEVIAEKDTEK